MVRLVTEDVQKLKTATLVRGYVRRQSLNAAESFRVLSSATAYSRASQKNHIAAASYEFTLKLKDSSDVTITTGTTPTKGKQIASLTLAVTTWRTTYETDSSYLERTSYD